MAFGVNPLTGRPGPAPKPARDGDKIQARQRINVEVRSGRRPRPDSLQCHDCQAPAAQYDHHLGYAPEHHLDVQPVCNKCHARRTFSKDHCVNGHPYDQANTGLHATGRRFCRTCRRARENKKRDAAWWRARRARKKAES